MNNKSSFDDSDGDSDSGSGSDSNSNSDSDSNNNEDENSKVSNSMNCSVINPPIGSLTIIDAHYGAGGGYDSHRTNSKTRNNRNIEVDDDDDDDDDFGDAKSE